MLTDRGLDAALRSLAPRAPLPVDVEGAAPGDPPLPPAVETALEALTNVAKYADARGATVRLARGGDRVIAEVADDGVGGASAAKGSGLRGLADRVAALDGRLEVSSPPGAGTIVRVEIPCDPDAGVRSVTSGRGGAQPAAGGADPVSTTRTSR